jgi:hypothetical protein
VTLRLFTVDEQAAHLEAVIGALRGGKRPATASIEVLKSIAKDLRARVNAPGHAVLLDLQRRIADAAASRTTLGWDVGALRGIAEQVIGHWPTIRQALERFGATK